MIPRYCFIQLTPLPKIPSDETEREEELRHAWFRNEVEQFKKWANVREGDKRATLNIVRGSSTKFLIQCSYNPGYSNNSHDKVLNYFIQDIFSACVYGDISAKVDGKSFHKRVRWSKKLEGNWSWKSSIGVMGDGVSLKKITDQPHPTYDSSSKIWADLLLGASIFLPIIAILYAVLGYK